MMVRALLLVLLLTILPLPLRAGEAALPKGLLAGDKPVTVTARQMVFDRKGERIDFDGQVLMIRGELRMEADKVTVHLTPERPGERPQIRTILARGKVHLTQAARVLTAEEALYEPALETVVLTGDPKVTEGEMVLAGKRITINLKTQQSTVEGGAVTFKEAR